MFVTVVRPVTRTPARREGCGPVSRSRALSCRTPFLIDLRAGGGQAPSECPGRRRGKRRRHPSVLPFDLGSHRVGMPIGDPMNNLQGFVSGGATIDARQVIRKAGWRGC
jgi:hypothetical protein